MGVPRLHMVMFFTMYFVVDAAFPPNGTWTLLVENAGIASMHTAVTHHDTVILLDRTNIGPSKINLTNAQHCRDNPEDQILKHDCTAHSVMFDPNNSNSSLRPLNVFSDTWCSSGQFVANGSLVQTGGESDGFYKIRRLDPCRGSEYCDWVELQPESERLVEGRWYASNQLLPDGRQIVLGGRYVYSYEFVPKRNRAESAFELRFLRDVDDDSQHDNMYPFVHLLPDGNLFIFANRDSILLDYVNDVVLKTYPRIPGEPRNYPSAGSSVLLPLDWSNEFKVAEVLVCGGAQFGAFQGEDGWSWPASETCGRIVTTASDPVWSMETMPVRRTMGDMIVLPTGDVVIINGAQRGCQGWWKASDPALNPVLYATYNAESRFRVLAGSSIARMYHSTANLLSDGRILLAGSNTHQFYTFTGDFPTELRLEAFHPPYLDPLYDGVRPVIYSVTRTTITYGAKFSVVFTAGRREGRVEVKLASAAFATHSSALGQRLLRLATTEPVRTVYGHAWMATAVAPASANVAPPSFYMLFALQAGVPSKATWVRISAAD